MRATLKSVNEVQKAAEAAMDSYVCHRLRLGSHQPSARAHHVVRLVSELVLFSEDAHRRALKRRAEAWTAVC